MATTSRWLLDESPGLIAIFDDSMTCQALSRNWRELKRLSEQDEAGIALEGLLDKEAAADICDALEAVLDGSEAIADRHVEIQGEDGTVPGRLSAWCAKRQSDGKKFIVLSVTETSELENAMHDLADLQARQEVILNAAGEGIYGLDANGRLTFGNPTSVEILGWHVDEILNEKAHDVHHHSYPDGTAYPRDACPIYATLTDGEVHRVDDEVFWDTDGKPLPVEYTSTPILQDGKPNGAVVVFRDISERRAVEQQRKESFAEIKALKEQLEQERDYLRDEIKVTVNFGEIIGNSPALQRSLAKVEAVASTSANVLVTGESGVGKEMIARAIHSNSERADKPLVKVNCASIPSELFESEFFGHVKGAFTGAHKDRVGRLPLAHGGTLFLDEVGEIPLSLQSKLLRALQEHEFERVGDDETISVDVRVVAASNRNLEEEIAAGRFREDLFYRLSVFPIELPPLRERDDDVVALASHFLQRICAELGRPQLSLSKEHQTMLNTHSWPGNIRELKNVIERAVILTKGQRLRLDLAMGVVAAPASGTAPVSSDTAGFLTEEEFREKERQNLIAVLRAAGGRVWGTHGAAALLGVKPTTLAYRMNALNIEKPAGSKR